MFKVNIEIVRGKSDFPGNGHLYTYEIIGTVDLDTYNIITRTGYYIVLRTCLHTRDIFHNRSGIWLSKKYSHIQSIEELKILMDMKGRRVVS